MLRELRRFGRTVDCQGKWPFKARGGLKIPSAPRPLYCISLIMSLLKASLEETQRNKLLGDFSQFKAFISNTRDNQLQNGVAASPTIRKDFSFLHPHTQQFWSLIPLEKQSRHLRGSQPEEFTVRAEHMCLNFPEIHRHLLKGAQEVEVRGCGATQDGRGYWQKSPARSHIHLCFLLKWGKQISLSGQAASLVSYVAPPSDPTLCTDRWEAAGREAFWELWGCPPWLTVPETTSKDPCLLVLWSYATFSPSVWQGVLTHFYQGDHSNRDSLSLLRLGDKNTVTSILLALCHSLVEFSLQEARCHMYELLCGNQGQELRAPANQISKIWEPQICQQPHTWTWSESSPIKPRGASSPSWPLDHSPITDRLRDGGLQLNCTQTPDPGKQR